MNGLLEILRSGNYKLASYVIGDKWKLDMFFLNQLHYEVLTVKEVKELYNFHRNSTNKNCNQGNFTPMHCAAINPNGQILQKLIENGGDIYAMDREGR